MSMGFQKVRNSPTLGQRFITTWGQIGVIDHKAARLAKDADLRTRVSGPAAFHDLISLAVPYESLRQISS